MNTAAREIVTSDGVVLRVMVIDDGEYLRRSGTTIVSDAGGGGGGSDHATLSNLGWTASGHTGTASRLAGFSGAGAAAYYQIGVDVQAYDAGLASLTAADAVAGLPYVTGANTWATATLGDLAVSGGAWRVTDLTITSEAQGSLLYFNGSNWVQLSPGTAGHVLQTGGAGANPSYRAQSSTVTYDTAGTYSVTIPTWATTVTVKLQGGGGGGAAGGRADPGTAAEGGAGGNSGYYAEWAFPVSAFTGDIQVIVGVGGTGATARVTNGGATGTGGSAGGDTSITDNNGAGAVVAVAQGGAAASARTAASVSNLSSDDWISNQGGAGSTGAANGAAGIATSLTVSPGSGGGGGAITAGNTPSNGGRGGKGGLGIDYDGATNGQAGGTAAGGNGTDAVASAGYRGAGGPGGGAGGAGDGSGNGGRGGDGTRGTGGGGGGAGHSPGSSGRGGNGGPGWAIITFS